MSRNTSTTWDLQLVTITTTKDQQIHHNLVIVAYINQVCHDMCTHIYALHGLLTPNDFITLHW